MSVNETDPAAWRIAFDPDNTTVSAANAEIAVTSLLDTQPAAALGEELSFALRLRPDGRAPDHVTRYRELVGGPDDAGYRAHAGAYASGLTSGFGTWFTERHNRASLLVALRPPDDSPTGRGVWGLISEIEDDTEVPQQVCYLTLSLTYLADLGAFVDATGAPAFDAARRTLETGGI